LSISNEECLARTRIIIAAINWLYEQDLRAVRSIQFNNLTD
jgi:hypothetical protein